LVQDYADFDLLISENHSSDGTPQLLNALAASDSRIRVLRPDQKLNSYGNFCFLASHVAQGDYAASMMLGGHDLLSHNVLSSSMQHLTAHTECAIAYQRNSFEIDEQDVVTRKWPVCHESGNMNTAFDVLLTLITLMYNTPIFGLWRQSVRQKVLYRHPCVGGDHLYVAEAALHGHITPIDSGQTYLRRAPPDANYLQKHFTDASGDQAAANDMYVQLAWLSDLVDQSTTGYPNLAQELYRTSAASLYLLRYNHHFATFQSSLNAFAAQPGINSIIQGQMSLGAMLKELLNNQNTSAADPN
jgi:hypothetical protein